MLSNGILAALLLADAVVSSNNIAPYYVDCPPAYQIVRGHRGLSRAESDWVHGRKAVAADAFSGYLTRLNLTDFDVQAYTAMVKRNPDWNMPVLAWATSGGAWRSAFTGVGGLRAIDSATPGANEQKIGGLLQSLTYIAGLSGGSFPTSSWSLSNYPSIDELVASWRVDVSRFGAETYSPYAAPVASYFEQIASKFKAGFNVSSVDFLGRAFAYEFLPRNVNATFSSITELSRFRNFSGPLPLLQASSLNKTSIVEEGLYVPYENATIFEWNPFEFGSWDIGWTPTKHVGTLPDGNGTISRCVENLDQASFVIGTVASAWNYWYIAGASNGSLGQFSKRSEFDKRQAAYFPLAELEAVNEVFNDSFSLDLPQIANPSVPNPFGGKENITLTDNSEAGQAVPFWNLIQPERKVDLIFAWDDDGDQPPTGWNNGTNIWDTYNLAKTAGLPFPEVPPPSTFLARNYTLHPVLFGCNTSLTTTGDSASPLVVYLTNAPYSWYSNFSAFSFNVSYTEFDGVLENSFNFMTQANGTLTGREDWVECIGCAAIDRSLQRMGMNRTDQCEQCFAKWCWDGTTTELPSDFVFNPSLELESNVTFAVWNETHPFSG